MALPHHFVFNELSRALNKAFKGEQAVPLVDALIENGIAKEADRKRYTGRNGMNFLIAYLRNRNFDTFVKFVECVGVVEKVESSASLVQSIYIALQTYDKEHESSFAEQISFGKESTPSLVQIEQTQFQGAGSIVGDYPQISEHHNQPEKNSKQSPIQVIPTTVDQMPGILENSISKTVVDRNGGTLSSFLHGYEITIPPGAVLEEKPIAVEVGVSTHGPYKLPEDQYRITDYLCVFADNKFQSPVTVSLSHCLELQEYTLTSSVAIMRADMNEINDNGEYIFRRLDFHPDISDADSTLSFKLTNFCVLCSVYNLESNRSRSYERQGSSTDSVGTAAAHLVRQVAIDDPSSSEGAVVTLSPQSSGEDRDGPYKTKDGSGLVLKNSLEGDDNRHLTSSGEMFVPNTRMKQKLPKKRAHTSYRPYPQHSTSSVKYQLLLCEPKHRDGNSFEVQIYACLNCPGSVQACMNQQKECNYTQHEFSFKSEEIELTVVNPNHGWTVISKVSPMKISSHAIQRYACHSKVASLVEQQQYPPRKVLHINWTEPSIHSTAGDSVCQIRVADAASASDVCKFTVTAPPLPSATLPGLSLWPTGAAQSTPQPGIYSAVPGGQVMHGGQVMSAMPGGQVMSAMPGGQVIPGMPGGQVLSAVPGGQVISVMPSGQVIPAVPGGQVMSAVPGGQVIPAMPGGQVMSAVPGGQVMSAVPGGQVMSAVPGGQVLSAVPGGQVMSAVPGGQVISAVLGVHTSLPTLDSGPSNTLQRSFSNEEKQALSNQVEREIILKLCDHIMWWKKLGRHLGLDDAKIVQLESDNKNDSNEATYQMLDFWSKKNDGDAPYQKLLDALVSSGEYQAVSFLLSSLSIQQDAAMHN